MERVSNNAEVFKSPGILPLQKEIERREKHFNGKKLVGVKELSEMLSIPIGTIYNMVSRREIPNVKIGRRTLFDLKTIEVWVEKHSFQPADFSNPKRMGKGN